MSDSIASITTILGMRGSGKSILTRKLSTQSQHARKIVFDINGEWSGTHEVHTYDEFTNIWRQVFHRNSFTIVILFSFGAGVESIQEIASQISSLVYRTGKDTGIYTTLIFEEAQFYFPTYNLSPELFSLLTVGRHGFIDIIANSQRPAQIHKTLISQSQDLYVGRLFEMNDIKYLYASIGEIALETRNLQPGEFIHYRIGQGADQVIQVF